MESKPLEGSSRTARLPTSFVEPRSFAKMIGSPRASWSLPWPRGLFAAPLTRDRAHPADRISYIHAWHWAASVSSRGRLEGTLKALIAQDPCRGQSSHRARRLLTARARSSGAAAVSGALPPTCAPLPPTWRARPLSVRRAPCPCPGPRSLAPIDLDLDDQCPRWPARCPSVLRS